jgi:hypothetical protein
MATDEAVDVSQLAPGTCTTCGNGQRGDPWGNPLRCSYCGSEFADGAHVHEYGMRVNGLAKCKGHRYLGCRASEYDSQWGGGIFSDWPRGHHKPYGA